MGRGGNIINNPCSGPHKIWLNSLKRKMTLTNSVLWSIMSIFLGKEKDEEDSYPSTQITLTAEHVQYRSQRPSDYLVIYFLIFQFV